ETKISSIMESQLTYAGYYMDDLAENAQFEEVIFLLWNYRLPNEEELRDADLNMLIEHGEMAELFGLDEEEEMFEDEFY
ncbi:citrate/2-methylcitrate synthase, partial [Staphylococcus aureus]|uniref:citrate/2-methylcitrate synthase n=1 Tax=Staphylococcus aureus TaxID=1280 RepID=UPI00272E4F0A